MSDEIIVGLISLGGVVFSAIISWFVAVYKSKQEIRKQMSETKQVILKEMLLPKRLETYRELLKITLDLGKKRHYPDGKEVELNIPQRTEKARQALKEIIDWQNNTEGYQLLDFRYGSLNRFRELKKLLKEGDKDENGMDPKTLQKIYDKRGELRTALARDLDIIRDTAKLDSEGF
jgi:hypothetical protein